MKKALPKRESIKLPITPSDPRQSEAVHRDFQCDMTDRIATLLDAAECEPDLQGWRRLALKLALTLSRLQPDDFPDFRVATPEPCRSQKQTAKFADHAMWESMVESRLEGYLVSVEKRAQRKHDALTPRADGPMSRQWLIDEWKELGIDDPQNATRKELLEAAGGSVRQAVKDVRKQLKVMYDASDQETPTESTIREKYYQRVRERKRAKNKIDHVRLLPSETVERSYICDVLSSLEAAAEYVDGTVRHKKLEFIENSMNWTSIQKSLSTSGCGAPIECFPALLMFKMLLLAYLYDASDSETVDMTWDKLSHRQFCGLKPMDRVPAPETLGLFRQRLEDANQIQKLMSEFDAQMRQLGVVPKRGGLRGSTPYVGTWFT